MGKYHIEGRFILYLLYNMILFLLLIILAPYLIYKIISGKYRKSLSLRLGFKKQNLENTGTNSRKPLIWVHAVSVGETAAAQPVVEQLREQSDCEIIFSTVTETGQQMARKIIAADQIIYFPLDFSWCINRVLKQVEPDAVAIMETELWPNFIRMVDRQESKIMLVNGRISDKSRTRYKYLGPLLADMLSRIDLFSMQSPKDREYIIELGAEESKVVNCGNTKFDRDFKQGGEWSPQEIRQEFKIKSQQKVIIAGSTHPDEEEQLLPVFKKIKKKFADTIFIIAPRHVKRAAEIQRIYQKAGLQAVLRTEIKKRDLEPVIIVDTIGELSDLYAVADLVFVGGSLMKKGGHNILEPAARGKPVFFGPYMFNFTDSVNLVKEHQAGVQVEDSSELQQKLLEYLKSPSKQKQIAQRALAMIDDNQGAAEENARLLLKMIN